MEQMDLGDYIAIGFAVAFIVWLVVDTIKGPKK
jgi:hypothetical protein